MAFYKGQRLVTDVESLKHREWLLDGLPARNRFLMKRVDTPVRQLLARYAKKRWRHRAAYWLYVRVAKLYKKSPGPNTEAIHTRRWPHTSGNGLQGQYPLKMVTPRMASEEAKRMTQGATPSAAVSWGRTVLDLTDGRRISLDLSPWLPNK